MALTSVFCNVAVMPVRREPNHRAEQTTQLLFGEKALVLDVVNKDWAYIRCGWDGYEGWCKCAQLSDLSAKDYKKPIKFISASHAGKIAFEDSSLYLPLGSELINLKKRMLTPVAESGVFKGKKQIVGPVVTDVTQLKSAALLFMNAPYQWGGRSIHGIDCSGLTQMAFKLCNWKIPRDANQQAEKGLLVDFLQNAQCGDLAFFDNKDGNIVHVGMLLDNQTIIHATDTSGRVVIDRIDPAGIVSITLKKRTHNLRFVKRMIYPEPPLPAKKYESPATLPL